MDVSLFDFDLPPELIALRPAMPRDSARMLVVRENGSLEHAYIRDLPEYLRRGDILVLNDTKVISARLRGWRAPRAGRIGTAAKIEITLHKRIAANRFHAFAKPARRLEPGDRVTLGESLSAEVAGCGERGEIDLIFAIEGSALDTAIAREGEMPLPPYIAGKRRPDSRDTTDYQTVFAARPGSIAAPTAGLHFTPELFANLARSGIEKELVTLHVGAGTFLPVTVEDTTRHRMHSEWADLPEGAAARLNDIRSDGGRIVAVGTTSLRTLESATARDGTICPFQGETALFITPGYAFRSVDVLLTNFHLPRSTLFMLVCAFSGLETMRNAYSEAIRERYRFYSYGDACLLFRNSEAK